MHQNRFRLGLRASAPDPTGGAYSAPPNPLAVFKGPTSKGKEGKGREEGKGRGRGGKREERGREGNGGKGENDLTHPLSQIPGYATDGSRSSSHRPLLLADGTRCSLPRTPPGERKLLTAVSGSRQLRVVVLIRRKSVKLVPPDVIF